MKFLIGPNYSSFENQGPKVIWVQRIMNNQDKNGGGKIIVL